jgi:ABC-type bacteriocin/lantibiotic exporter with double-glycine peptidase domain
VLLAGVMTTLLSMITPQAMAILIDQAIPDADRRLLMQIGLGLFAAALGSTLFQLAQGFAIMRLETFADATTQAAIWDRLLALKPAFFRQYAIGDLNSRVSAVSQIRQKLSSTVMRSVFSSLFSLLNLGLLFYYSSTLAMIAVLVALVNVAVTVVSGILTVFVTARVKIFFTGEIGVRRPVRNAPDGDFTPLKADSGDFFTFWVVVGKQTSFA